MVDVSNSVSSGLVISKRTSLNTVFFVGEAYSEARILTKVGLAAGCICYTTLSNALSILSPSWKIQEEEDEKRGMLGWLNKHAMIVLTKSGWP
jgi:hypothetical protein